MRRRESERCVLSAGRVKFINKSNHHVWCAATPGAAKNGGGLRWRDEHEANFAWNCNSVFCLKVYMLENHHQICILNLVETLKCTGNIIPLFHCVMLAKFSQQVAQRKRIRAICELRELSSKKWLSSLVFMPQHIFADWLYTGTPRT